MQFSIVFLYQDDEQPDDLSFPDNNEDDDSLENLKLLWHGEIEEKLDKAHPLLCTMIYDSCRWLYILTFLSFQFNWIHPI